MKVQLLYADRSFSWDQGCTSFADQLVQDLQLEPLLQVMSGGDRERRGICRQVLLHMEQQEGVILYRQEILQDFLAQPWMLQELRALLVQLREREQAIRQIGLIMEYPTSLTAYGRDRLQVQREQLEALRLLGRKMEPVVQSAGLRAFLHRIVDTLTDTFFEQADRHLQNCRFKTGIRAAVTLGEGLRPVGFVSEEPDGSSFAALRSRLHSRPYTFAISEDDSNGMKALSTLEQKCLNGVGNVLMQTATHVDGFFSELDRELTFYEGAAALWNTLQGLGCPTAFPAAGPWQYQKLSDAALTLQKQQNVVGNTHSFQHKSCVLITGANQGGKTTFLRSVGQAVLMAQAGLFVAAESFRCPLYTGLFTHFRREEDRSFKSGKLDEELQRMDVLIDRMNAGSLLLMNESFAATNEADGSEIAWQVMTALMDQGIQIFCVTHFYALAEQLQRGKKEQTLFLQAVRNPDGSRTYALREGTPASTGHGRDLYEKVFKKSP